MNIAICEDNASDANLLVNYIRKYCEHSCCQYKIMQYKIGEELLDAHSPGMFDLIFMDVYMEGLNGIEVVEQIRKTDALCDVVFVTASKSHSLESYRLQAVYYMVKPICENDVKIALRMCRRNLVQNSRYIEVMVNRESVKLLLRNIVYIETFDRALLIHTKSHTYKTYLKLDHLEKKAGGLPFIRCHRGFLINMNHIQKIEQFDFIMTGGQKVPIRKNGRADIKQAFADFVLGKM